jgi:hypothetical protein
MALPSYYLTRPAMDLDAETIAAFERLYAESVESGTGAEINYTLSAPKWQFLCYLSDNKGILLHGSGNPDIDEFEPRQSNDTMEFGNRRAVYAASDALWAMYFAIVDKNGGVTSLVNACFRVVHEDGTRSEPYYFFSINGDALAQKPWRDGTIYVLPRTGFEQAPSETYQELKIDVEQWASPAEVKPLARLAVRPDDFPFLSQIRGHDMQIIGERARSDPEGFPWLDEE